MKVYVPYVENVGYLAICSTPAEADKKLDEYCRANFEDRPPELVEEAWVNVEEMDEWAKDSPFA